MTAHNTAIAVDRPLSTTLSFSPSKKKHTRNKSSDFENDPIIPQDLGLPFLGIPFKGEVLVADSDSDQKSTEDGEDEERSSYHDEKGLASSKSEDTTMKTSTLSKGIEASSLNGSHRKGSAPMQALGHNEQDSESSTEPNEATQTQHQHQDIEPNEPTSAASETRSWHLSDVSSDIYSSSDNEIKRDSTNPVSRNFVPEIILEHPHPPTDATSEEHSVTPTPARIHEGNGTIDRETHHLADSALNSVKKLTSEPGDLPDDSNALMINFGPDIILEITGSSTPTPACSAHDAENLPNTPESNDTTTSNEDCEPSCHSNNGSSKGVQGRMEAKVSDDEENLVSALPEPPAPDHFEALHSRPDDQIENDAKQGQLMNQASSQYSLPKQIKRKSVASGRASIDAGKPLPWSPSNRDSPQKHPLHHTKAGLPPSPQRPPPPVPPGVQSSLDQSSDQSSQTLALPASPNGIALPPQANVPSKRLLPPTPAISHPRYMMPPETSSGVLPRRSDSLAKPGIGQTSIFPESSESMEIDSLGFVLPEQVDSAASRDQSLHHDQQSSSEGNKIVKDATTPSMLSSAMSSPNPRSSMSGSSETRSTTFSTLLSENPKKIMVNFVAEQKEKQASAISKSLTLLDKGKGLATSKRLSRLPSIMRLPGRLAHDDKVAVSISSAAREGNMALLSKLLKENPKLIDVMALTHNYTVGDPKTPMMWAAAEGHIACLEILTKYEADCFVLDRHGKTALHHALGANKLDSAEWLVCYSQTIAKEKSINPTYFLDLADKEGSCAIHVAAGTGDVAALKLLQRHGAKSDAIDNANRTPVHIAVLLHRLEALKYLIAQGCDTNACDNSGRTPLMLGVRANGQVNVKVLVEHGADRTRVDMNGELAIHHACRMGHLTILEMLYMSSEDLEVTNNLGERPLHLAVKCNHPRIVRALLRANCQANPWTKPPPVTKSKTAKPRIKGTSHPSNLLASTPLHYACASGNYDITAALLQHGAGVNLNQEDGTSPLMLACEAASPGLVQLLIQAFANVNAANSTECLTALHVSCAKNDVESAKLLVENGANTRAKLTNRAGETPGLYGRRLLRPSPCEAANYVFDYNVKTMAAQVGAAYGSSVSITNGARDQDFDARHVTARGNTIRPARPPPSYDEAQAQRPAGQGPAQHWKPSSFA